MEKYQISVDGIVIDCDKLAFDYPQTDSEASGATEQNVMYRDVLPERMKLICGFERTDEVKAAKLLQIRAKVECTVDFYDLRSRGRRSLRMYPVADEIQVGYMLNGTFYCEPFELRFIQTVPDGVN